MKLLRSNSVYTLCADLLLITNNVVTGQLGCVLDNKNLAIIYYMYMCGLRGIHMFVHVFSPNSQSCVTSIAHVLKAA